ncbi:MAG: 30S ribosomal protein S12 methylthiotransferase RimO [bacterium]|nr:30S ribosomal protein S12 methylthiotransferase RimO [bacterium]
MKLKSIGIISLGCSKNLADTEVMAGSLLQAGYRLSPSPDHADVILVNTCAFIEPARAEGAENIMAACAHKANGACKAVIVAGCMSQRYREQMEEAFPDVDAFLGVDDLDRLVDILKALEAKRRPSVTELSQPLYDRPALPTRLFDKPMPSLRLTGPVFAYVKIAEGCNHACAFCAIPQFRGHLRSRPQASILAEIKELLATGTKEINLIGQDTTAYGKDLRDGTSLATLLKEIDALEGDFWVRFLYGFHNHVTDELLEVLANAKHVLPYFDLPIQHSEPEILRGMRRADTIKAIDTFPERLRKHLPEATLRTTCMVGFPGETEEQFEKLCAYVEKWQFDHLGTFIFSPEEGTAAATMEGLPEPAVAQRRFDRLMKLQKRIAKEKNKARIGMEATALVVDFDEQDGLYVRLPHQAPEVDGLTHLVHAPEAIQPGDFIRVKITGARGYDLTAKCL